MVYSVEAESNREAKEKLREIAGSTPGLVLGKLDDHWAGGVPPIISVRQIKSRPRGDD
jgi:hypothetical protein